MKVKALIAFKSKLFKPCSKLFLIFKFRLRKPLSIRGLHFRPQHVKAPNSPMKKQTAALSSIFHSCRQLKEMDRVIELKSFSETGQDRLLFPSPLTPAYIKISGARKRETLVHKEVEDACRSFENYLAEMIVEEGRVRDLMDVEELLNCWKSLKCPVFIDLVSRFYGELCKDLFSTVEAEDVDSSM